MSDLPSKAELDEAERPDNRGPAIVVTGGVCGGFEFHGPFESIDAALKWYKTSLFGIVKCPVTVALLTKPAEARTMLEALKEPNP